MCGYIVFQHTSVPRQQLGGKGEKLISNHAATCLANSAQPAKEEEECVWRLGADGSVHFGFSRLLSLPSTVRHISASVCEYFFSPNFSEYACVCVHFCLIYTFL